jgi:tetratricopeptide (TPR) repeat protein
VLHARIVEALEALAGDRLDDQVERLAQHALRGEVWEKALAYGRQAGDKAHARLAYREAVVCYEQALEALAHLPDSHAATEQAIDLRLSLRPALNALGAAPQRILDDLCHAEVLAQTLGDDLRLGWVYATMGAHCLVAGDMGRAIVSGQRALALAATLGHVGLQARAHLSLGQAYHDTGDYARAVKSLGQNVVILRGDLLAERFGTNGSVAVISHAWLSFCHAERGAFAEGLAIAQDGLRIAETLQSPFSLIAACRGLSFVSLRQGDVHRAIPVLERAMGLCQEWHIPIFFLWVATALGLAYALEGHVTAGLALAEQGVELAVAHGRLGALAPLVAWLSEVYLLAGRLEEARPLAQQALALARTHKEGGHEACALRLLGEIVVHRDPLEIKQAERYYQEALTLAEALEMRPLQAHCHRGLGTLYATTGQREQAHIELAMAIERYQSMDMTFWLPQTEAALAQVEGR